MKPQLFRATAFLILAYVSSQAYAEGSRRVRLEISDNGDFGRHPVPTQISARTLCASDLYPSSNCDLEDFEETRLELLRRDAMEGGYYREPTVRELMWAKMLFRIMLLGGGTSPQIRRLWGYLGFDVYRVYENRKVFTVLTEQKGSQFGRGFYAFGEGQRGAKILLQAPHSNDDLSTGTIASQLFSSSQQIPFAAWNTIPRKEADLAHRPASYFQTLTRAFAETFPSGLVVQIHGFSREERKTPQGKISDLILSQGRKDFSPWFLIGSQVFKDLLSPWTVYRYPIEVTELGGTTNAQANLLHGQRHRGFLHVEMSREFRDTLQCDRKVQRLWLRALQKTYRYTQISGGSPSKREVAPHQFQ